MSRIAASISAALLRGLSRTPIAASGRLTPPNRPACRTMANARSWKTIFSTSRISPPEDWRFRGARKLRSASD
jgi:hypothetical protein